MGLVNSWFLPGTTGGARRSCCLAPTRLGARPEAPRHHSLSLLGWFVASDDPQVPFDIFWCSGAEFTLILDHSRGEKFVDDFKTPALQ